MKNIFSCAEVIFIVFLVELAAAEAPGSIEGVILTAGGSLKSISDYLPGNLKSISDYRGVI